MISHTCSIVSETTKVWFHLFLLLNLNGHTFNRIILHSYFNFELLWHDKFICFDRVKIMSLLVFSSHLILILLLLLHFKLLSLNLHRVHLLHLIWINLHHSWVHLMHLSWIHLNHIWILLVHHLLLNIGIYTFHFHIVHLWLFHRYFLLLFSNLLLLWWR